MIFRPCIIIPVYNHSAQLREFAPAIRALDLPILLVDDGSDAGNRPSVSEIAAELGAILIARSRNGGKGAAMVDGFRRAAQAGFSHAVQIDADGQHDAAEIPRFLTTAQQHPDALVMGRAIFDGSVPRARFYGRYLTHAMVRVECMSPAIKDAFCGLRVYPLAATLALLARRQVGPRMEFDIDIAVRLYWSGVPVINLDTPVRYPAQGRSHFRSVSDNARISLLHTRLLLESVLRFPALVRRRKAQTQNTHWAEDRERGSYLLLRTLLAIYRCGGRPLARLLVYPVVFYFFITSRQSRRASMDFLRQLHTFCPDALGHPPTLRDSIRQHLALGMLKFEEVDAWCGHIGRQQVHWPNRQILIDLVNRKQGAVILGAHIGSIEILRGIISTRPEFKFNALVFQRHAARINRLLRAANPQCALNLIHIDAFTPDVAISLQEHIARGEFIVVLADRRPVGARSRIRWLPFLGKPAPFPEGPFHLAALLGGPLFFLFCVKSGGKEYHVELEEVEPLHPVSSRRQRDADRARVMQSYVHALERQVCRAPFQWFNFFDFWGSES